MQLNAEEILHIQVKCSKDYEVKQGPDGYLRVIPITGGIFDGKIKGTVLNGGADWNTERTNHSAHVFAKYMLQTDDGAYIAIENEGVIESGSKDVIKTAPRFITEADGKYGWLNYGIYVGSLEPGKGEYAVDIKIYRLL